MKRVKYFYSNSCEACEIMTPIMESIDESGLIDIEYIDTSKDRDQVQEFFITKIPTILVTGGDDEELSRFIGFRDEKITKGLIKLS